MTTQGARIRNIRQELKLSQEEFGRKIGVSKQYVSNLEADRNVLNNEKLVLLLVDLKVNVNYILAGVGNKFLSPQFEDAKEEILKEVDQILVKYGVKKL